MTGVPGIRADDGRVVSPCRANRLSALTTVSNDSSDIFTVEVFAGLPFFRLDSRDDLGDLKQPATRPTGLLADVACKFFHLF